MKIINQGLSSLFIDLLDKNMSKTELSVFNLIKKNNYVRTGEIAKIISKSDKTVYRAIKRLKELKYIERVGDDYNGYWTIVEK